MASPNITWSALGRKHNSSVAQQAIEITEEGRSVSMGPGEEPYGVAVDAPLAVQLIRNFWKKFRSEAPEKTWLRTTFEQSRAITFDKNILLKILSQPKSEGIRFYFCLKNTEKGDVLSLVAVGVDEKGKDLLYEFNAEVQKSGIENIPTRSLVAEYGHPPGFASEPDPGLEPFVLFRYSEI